MIRGKSTLPLLMGIPHLTSLGSSATARPWHESPARKARAIRWHRLIGLAVQNQVGKIEIYALVVEPTS